VQLLFANLAPFLSDMASTADALASLAIHLIVGYFTIRIAYQHYKNRANESTGRKS
jgi:hypothetical protein